MKLRVVMAVALAGAVFSSPALAAKPKDAQALKAIHDAVEKDFLELRFDDAEQKLRGAIEKCGQDGCTPAVKAKAWAALGSVLAAGKKQIADSKEAFIEALNLDKAATPNPDIASTEADYAFEQAKKEVKGVKSRPAAVMRDEPKKPEKPPPPTDTGKSCRKDEDCSEQLACQDGVCAPPPDVPSSSKSKEDEAPSNERKNWLILSFSPDAAVYAGQNVCTKQNRNEYRFVCYRSNQTLYDGTPTVDNADNVTPGLSLGTMRVLLGFERIVASNVGLALRVGFAFNGATDAGASFLPVHLDGRVSYYLGRKPFAGTGVRPSVFLVTGLAEVDTSVPVNVLEDGRVCHAAEPGSTKSPCTKRSPDGVLEPRVQTLNVYKQAGPGIGGGGFSFAIAPVEGIEFILALRVDVTFPSVVLNLAPEGGFALGF